MNKKKYYINISYIQSIILIFIMLVVIISLKQCNSEYNKQVKRYEALFDSIAILLDSENVYESIKDNDLSSKFKELDNLLNELQPIVPDSKIAEFIVLRTRHDILGEAIEKGLKWDSLGGLDRLSVEHGIKCVKPKQQ